MCRITETLTLSLPLSVSLQIIPPTEYTNTSGFSESKTRDIRSLCPLSHHIKSGQSFQTLGCHSCRYRFPSSSVYRVEFVSYLNEKETET